MDESRIGEVYLKVHATGDDASLRDRAEGFARAVFELVVELLEARAPGRLIFVRRLPLSWTVGEELLAVAEPRALAASIERFARELAAEIAARLPAGTSLVPGDGDLVVFDDEATWRAA